MPEDHKPLPVAGYTPQSHARIALVNEFKQDEERLLRKLDALRKGVVDNSSIPVAPGEWRDIDMPILGDPRWLAIAQTNFELAFMALNRAVFQPQRVKLPEDGE